MTKKHITPMFENATLYTQYLSNANRPLPIEPIMMGGLFYNYKTLLKLCKEEDHVSEDSLIQVIANMEGQKPVAKVLFDKTCERWRGLLYSLHKEDREQLLSMLVNCCNSLDEGAAKMLINQGSGSSVSIFFFFCLVLQNQKLIERIKNSVNNRENIKANGTLFDYVD